MFLKKLFDVEERMRGGKTRVQCRSLRGAGRAGRAHETQSRRRTPWRSLGTLRARRPVAEVDPLDSRMLKKDGVVSNVGQVPYQLPTSLQNNLPQGFDREI